MELPGKSGYTKVHKRITIIMPVYLLLTIVVKREIPVTVYAVTTVRIGVTTTQSGLHCETGTRTPQSGT